jgi:hypothetical protein
MNGYEWIIPSPRLLVDHYVPNGERSRHELTPNCRCRPRWDWDRDISIIIHAPLSGGPEKHDAPSKPTADTDPFEKKRDLYKIFDLPTLVK